MTDQTRTALTAVPFDIDVEIDMRIGTGLSGGRRSLLQRGRTTIARAAVESLESRRLLSTAALTSGFGEGGLRVVVDPYGAFGLLPTENATQFSDFTVGDTGKVTKSYIYFAPAGRYLTSSTSTLVPVNAAQTPALPTVDFTEKSARSAVSQFRLTGTSPTGEAYDYQIQLVQSVSQVGPTSYRRDIVNDILLDGQDPSDFDLSGIDSGLQTEFIQSYRVTNLLGTTTSLSMTRFFQGTDFVGGSNLLADGGRTLIVDSGFADRSYIQLSVNGGDFRGGAIRGGNLDAIIASRNGLTGDLFGVEGGADSSIDPETSVLGTGFLPGFAQATDFTIGGRQTVEFRTSTTFATGLSTQLVSASSFPISVVGNVAFANQVQNYDFPTLTSGALRPLTVTVTRLGGTRGALTADLTILPATTTPLGAINLTTPSVTFSEGQSSADVTILVDPALAGVEPSRILLALSTSTNYAGVGVPATLEINVYPQAPVFSLSSAGTSSPTYQASQGDGTEAITVFRRGLPNGSANITLRSQLGGSAFAGDIAVSFADGETQKQVALPIRTTDTGTSPLAVTLSLLPAAPTSGLTPVVVAGSGTLQLALRDTLAPTVTGLATQIDRKKIVSITLNFSEALASPGGRTNYVLLQRSGEGAFGSARLRTLQVSEIAYDPATQSVTLKPRTPLNFNTSYQVQVRPGGELADLAGNTLNQNPGGVANYNGLFAYGNRVSYVDQSGDTVRLRMSAGNLLLVRQPNGDSATLTLFGDPSRTSVLTGTVTARGQSGGTTPLGTLFNTSEVQVNLPPAFVTEA